MTREDIIRMAREAGHAIRNIDGEDEVMDGDNYHIQTELIERFAVLVAAAERKARPWQGLTDDEKRSMVEWAHPDIIDAIELKLKERNT